MSPLWFLSGSAFSLSIPIGLVSSVLDSRDLSHLYRSNDFEIIGILSQEIRLVGVESRGSGVCIMLLTFFLAAERVVCSHNFSRLELSSFLSQEFSPS